jgi:hypothetical protein
MSTIATFNSPADLTSLPIETFQKAFAKMAASIKAVAFAKQRRDLENHFIGETQMLNKALSADLRAIEKSNWQEYGMADLLVEQARLGAAWSQSYQATYQDLRERGTNLSNDDFNSRVREVTDSINHGLLRAVRLNTKRQAVANAAKEALSDACYQAYKANLAAAVESHKQKLIALLVAASDAA